MASQQLIIFVGLQGSGKSTYYHRNFAAPHVLVSKDMMTNSRIKDVQQEQMIDKALTAGQSVVVDNTNPTAIVRSPLIGIGKRHGARVIAYYFVVPVKVAVARNRQREGKARVPDVAIFVTAKKLIAPKFEEGFDEIHVVAAETADGEAKS